jgi:DNA polymerase elongation subunit (family B)
MNHVIDSLGLTLSMMPELDHIEDEIPHNEGTTTEGGTTPSIGTGDIKVMRDYACVRYTVGVSLDNLDQNPINIVFSEHCIMSYDLECEYKGPATGSIQTPILCCSIYCSCGYNMTISRTSLRPTINHIVVPNNEKMAVNAMELIRSHAPIFTLGHNIYEFDNFRLACTLLINCPYRNFFLPTSSTIGKTVSNMGFIMCIPGINNFDMLRCMRKAMPQKFKSFSLENLAADLKLTNRKLNTDHMKFELEWFQQSILNAIWMAKYNLMDCQVNLELCRHQDLLNQIVRLCRITRSHILDVMIHSTGAMAASSLCSYALKQNKCYVWTRCNHYPKEFIGGHVHFRSPIVCSSPMICGLGSMYPSIMKCANISPETIDYIDKETYGK